MEITEQLPSVAVVKGWTQHGTKNHIQSQLPPFSNEFSAVSLEGKTEDTTMSVGQQWQINAYSIGKGGKNLPGCN